MSVANTIIEQLKEDLENKIDPNTGYMTDPEIKYGKYMYNQVTLDPPTICFADTLIDPQEVFGDQGTAWLNILLYGYAKHDGLGGNDTIRDLALDTLKFILKDFTYTNDTELVSGLEIIPGGEGMPASLFTLEIRVKFDWTLSNIND